MFYLKKQRKKQFKSTELQDKEQVKKIVKQGRNYVKGLKSSTRKIN